MMMIDNDFCIEAHKPLVDAVHKYGIPYHHADSSLRPADKIKENRENPGRPFCPEGQKRSSEERPHELSGEEIEKLIDAFVQAIGRAQQSGFDGVQLHAAHGYLLSQFLSPYMNRRKDKWGGTTENRFRIVQEIYQRARKKYPDYPIMIKMNAYDGRRNGMRIDEALRISQLLEKAGCSAIEVSCGVIEDGFHTLRGEKIPVEALFAYHFKFKDLPPIIKAMIKPFADIVKPPVRPITNYNVPAAQAIKAHVTVPVIVVGGLRYLMI